MKTQNILLTRSQDRGHTKFDWLDSRHSFSFGDFYDPQRMGFGPLRVVNEDKVMPGGGFPSHPHKNMEIVSIVLKGQLEHKDSMGNGRVIESGDIQYMSAGSGVIHSEFNPSESETAHFLQIWFEPEERDLPPRYEDKKLLSAEANTWRLVLSGNGRDESIAIRRHVELLSATLEGGHKLSLENSPDLPKQWVLMLSGSLDVAGEGLVAGDSLALTEPGEVAFENKGSTPSNFMVFSLPV